MAALHTACASAQGLVTPASDNARGQPGVIEGEREADSGDCAAKLIATATARAALLGIEVRELAGGAWLLQHASGSSIGVAQGLQGLRAAVDGFQAARDDVADLVQRIGAREAPAAAAQSDDRGRVQALTQRLQCAGWTLTHADESEAFAVSRWGMARDLPDLAAVEAFARLTGAAA